jgi:hypothetical protein
MKKHHLYHVTMWFFPVFHSNSWFRNPAWETNIPRQIHRGINWDIIVYHAHAWTPRSETIWRSRAVVCNFVQNYRRFIKLTKDFQISNIYVKNSGIHNLKIIFASSFKVYSELGGFINFRYNISFIDPPLGGFGGILP